MGNSVSFVDGECSIDDIFDDYEIKEQVSLNG